jgi:hypothetical protein
MCIEGRMAMAATTLESIHSRWEIAVRRGRPKFRFGVLMCLTLGKVVLLSGCGSPDSSSAVTVASAKAYADGARQIEENNKKHIREALAARKAARAKR